MSRRLYIALIACAFLLPAAVADAKLKERPGRVRLKAKTRPKGKPAPKKPEGGPSPHDLARWGVRVGLGLALLVYYRSWRRKEDGDGLTDAPESPPPARQDAARNFARPVFLDKGGRNYDAGAELDDVIERFGDDKTPLSPASPSGTPTLALYDPPPHSAIRGLTPRVTPQLAVKLRRPSPAPNAVLGGLPLALRPCFGALPGETTLWHAPFFVKGVGKGHAAITNLRLVSAYERRSIALWPPRWATGTRLSSTPLVSIGAIETGSERRASFLIAGALAFLWYPFGSCVAVAAMALFVLARRPVLEVTSGHGIKRLPLALADRQEALRILSRLKATGARGFKKAS